MLSQHFLVTIEVCEDVNVYVFPERSEGLAFTSWILSKGKGNKKANKLVKIVMNQKKVSSRGKYSDYTDINRARIGKYATENGTTRACRYFYSTWKNEFLSPVRRFKAEYLKKLSELKDDEVTFLPTKSTKLC